jgi:hypothetical protein
MITVIKRKWPQSFDYSWLIKFRWSNLANKLDFISYHFYNDMIHLEYETNGLLKKH